MKSTHQQKPDKSAPVSTIKGIKAFNKDLTCRDFQFKEGETYKHEGDVKACSSGFHFCENPIDVFSYYSPADSVFHAVTGSGQIDKHEEDSKIACSEIKIGASVSIKSITEISFSFVLSKCKKSKSKNSTGDSSASSATGDRSASSATGDSSASSATGYSSASSATGYRSAAMCTGLNSKATAGVFGCIALAWLNEKENRTEMKCAETGCGDGTDGKLKSGTWYSLSEDGLFVEVE